MKQIYKIALTIALLASLGACTQEEVESYTGRARLHFFKGKYNTGDAIFEQRDSLTQSFYGQPAEQTIDTVYIELRTMGAVSEKPRPFRLEQTNAGAADAAVAGKHYIADERMATAMQIPAGAVAYRMPLYILRGDTELETKKFRLDLRIAENEHFGIGLEQFSRFRVTITSMAEQPAAWNSFWRAAFGTWGAKKMWFVMEYVGIKDFTPPAFSDYSYQDFLRGLARRKLAEYNADESHTDRPLREADGTEVKF